MGGSVMDYAVTEATACSSHVSCTNSHGAKFQCTANNTCCGDVCAGPGSVCCHTGKAPGFPCAPGNKCCGNSCQAPGSRCCRSKGMNYPVTKDTKCAGWETGSRPCVNRYGVSFYCSKDSSCCGDIWVLAAHAVKTSMEMILYVHLVGDVGQMSALQVQMPATVLSRWGIATQHTPTVLASKDRRQFC